MSASLRLLYALTFLFVGAHANFFPLWLRDAGWSEPQIGWLDGLRYACVIATPLLWGRLADRRGEAVGVLRLLALGGLISFLPVLVTDAFWPLLIAMTVWAAFRVAQVPTLDAVTLSRIEIAGGEYGRYRSWGSAGFILGSLALGGLIESSSRAVIPWALTGVLIATLLMVLLMPREAIRPRARDRIAPSLLQASRSLLARRPVRSIYAVAFASRFAMHGLYGFLPLHLADIGVGDAMLPVYWSTGVLSEILLIRRSRRLFGRWETRSVLGLCFAAAVLQYGLTAAIRDPWALLPVMALHGVTFGVWYVVSMEYLGAHVAHEERATAQALFQLCALGLGGTVSAIVAGYLYASGQGALMFGCGAGAALVGLGWILLRFPTDAKHARAR